MVTAYPGALDNFTNPTAADNLSTATVLHHSQHSNVNDAVRAIEVELGTNPKGTYTSVQARIQALETASAALQPTSQKGQPNGYAGLDAGGLLAQNIDAGKVASGTLATARVPNLDAGKVTTGVFNIARIPQIPLATGVTGLLPVASIPNHSAALLTSGTLDAARLPSTVTSNANSQVVADTAARDAIPTGSRVNGMLVTVLNPFTLYAWRSDNSTWVQIGGPGGISEPTLRQQNSTAITGFNNTTPSPGTGSQILYLSFNAPQSGRIKVAINANFEVNTTGQILYLGFQVRTGTAQGGGTVFQDFDINKALNTGAVTRTGCGMFDMVSGLTPGNPYHVQLMHEVTGSTGDIYYRSLVIEMDH